MASISLWGCSVHTNDISQHNVADTQRCEDRLSASSQDQSIQCLKTGVVSQNSVTPAHENWGRFLPYYEGNSDHIRDILTGVAIIKPGEQIHPPHKHPEEEFLMILEGNGTWTIGTNNMPANTGDIMYSAPNEFHGLQNTGNSPLKFVVFKYNPKN